MSLCFTMYFIVQLCTSLTLSGQERVCLLLWQNIWHKFRLFPGQLIIIIKSIWTAWGLWCSMSGLVSFYQYVVLSIRCYRKKEIPPAGLTPKSPARRSCPQWKHHCRNSSCSRIQSEAQGWGDHVKVTDRQTEVKAASWRQTRLKRKCFTHTHL